jgi:diguanylate cyclase (GGDEF)-like protein/PAS domain S-box-containing protein
MQKLKILIVDDVLDNLRMLSHTLAKESYEIRCAKNGALALRGVQSFTPNLILLDVNMPDMDGYEVCQRLKADKQTCNIPVIFLSAYDDALDKVKAFSVGAADYITKPFHVDEALARIKHQLALQEARQEIIQLNASLEKRVQQRTAELEAANRTLHREIAERHQAESRLQSSEERLSSILNSLDDIVWSASIRPFRMLYMNPATEKVYGYPATDFLSDSTLWLDVIHPEDRLRVEQELHNLVKAGGLEVEYRIIRPDGEIRWLSNRSRVIYNATGIPVRIDGIIHDFTDRKRIEFQLMHDALHDTLTQLPNRSLFAERIQLALDRTKRRSDYLFAVLFIDLDRFKVVNDSLGHLVGDQLLMAIATLLKGCLRTEDVVARFGGDEFTILLEDIKAPADAIQVAERIQLALSSPFQLGDHTVFTSASIGIVLGSTGYQNASDLLRDADIAMYRAKSDGKACYAVFDQDMYEATLELLRLESSLRQAVEQQELFIHYQPIASLSTGELIGFEALLRWHHPTLGYISPGKFIPLAEETGLIVSIGTYVLRQACQQLSAWQAKLPQAKKLKLHVNVASQQLKNSSFLQQINAILEETGIDGNCLRLEITEGTLMDHSQATLKLLHQLRERGIQLSIDDFGKGYSSLSYLRRFPIDTLKIDQSFVNSMNTDPDNFEIVRTIITLAHTLGLDVVAEGVETAAQLAQLQYLGCEAAQGYLFSKPIDPTAAEELMSTWRQRSITRI